jgi:tRNA-2-methylthio-N6-dimethylallyladenosine synthase
MKSSLPKVFLETHGCQMNVSDTERVKTVLVADGYEIVSEESAADVVLLNTCSVRERAEQKLYTRVGEIRSREQREKSEKQTIVGVLGCVAQLEGESLLSKKQKIDFVVGTSATGRISRLIIQAVEKQKCQNQKYQKHLGREKIFDLGVRESFYDWSVNKNCRSSEYVAFVPIIEGCNKFCTYCIVPFSRGRERSRSAKEILSEIRRLKSEGVKEIHLIGQNVNSYRPRTNEGLEKFAGATPFVKLLRAAAATEIERIKFTTSFPRDFHSDIVRALNENENLCNWVHLPVQSGSNRILRFMRRGHLIEDYYKHVEAIKNSPRRIALTSDIIVGFPCETEEDFADTLALARRCEFDGLYIFKYSPRQGTPAASMLDDVSAEEKTLRFLTLEKTQREIQKKIFGNYVNRVVSVLAESKSPKSEFDLSGHTTCQKVVNFTAAQEKLGTIVEVKITEAKSNTLYGEILAQ